MHTALNVLIEILFFIYRPVFYLIVIVDTTILGIITILLSFFDPTGNTVHYIGVFWSRLNLFLSGVRVRVHNKEYIKKDQPYIVMMNHQSHYDVWAAIGYIPLQLRWVMKMELRRIPIFGLGCERMGHIYIDRGDSHQAHESLKAAGEKIRNGASVVFFPEGTRSPDGKLLPFKKGGFVIAIESRVPILPITGLGSRAILPKGSMAIRPGTIDLIIHPPIDVTGYTQENKEELMERVRAVIQSKLAS
ncbi:MAG: lysophospholipid acyltransferase family protein [Spirochaetota bacterium]